MLRTLWKGWDSWVWIVFDLVVYSLKRTASSFVVVMLKRVESWQKCRERDGVSRRPMFL